MVCLPSKICVRSKDPLVVKKSKNIASYSSTLLSLRDPDDVWIVILCHGEVQMDPFSLEQIDLIAVPAHPGFKRINLADLFCHQCHLDRVVQRSRKAHQVSIPHNPPWARFLWVIIQRREVQPRETENVLVQFKFQQHVTNVSVGHPQVLVNAQTRESIVGTQKLGTQTH